MRDCANCFHRKPVLKEDGTWTAECEKWDCEFQSRENMIEKTEAIFKPIANVTFDTEKLKELTDEIVERIKSGEIVLQDERLKGKWIKADNLYDTVVCNKCGGIRRDNRIDHIAFCNKCGADMRGEKE